MKPLMCFVLFCVCLMGVRSAQAQQSQTIPPVYLRLPEIPPFQMTTPSGKAFTDRNLNKKKPTVIFLFSVDCEHCMHETEDLIKHISQFKGTQVVMMTPFSYDEMVAYYKGYSIQRYKDVITMGSDSTRRLNYFYQMHYFPGLYVYRNNHIVFHHEGTLPVDSLLHYLKP